MKKTLPIVAMLTVLFLAVYVSAADKVVVVPLLKLICADGFTKCLRECVDTNNDPGYCGDCTTSCSADEYCVNGICAIKCPDGLTDCFGNCVDTNNDPDFCGDCSTICDTDNICDQGLCKKPLNDACSTHSECASGKCLGNICMTGKIVFVSSGAFKGNLGSYTGANLKCQMFAEAAGLPGSYYAWISTVITAPAWIMTQHPYNYVRVDGVVVANNFNDLIDYTIDNPITVTEYGTLKLSEYVWTGTAGNGEPAGIFGTTRCDDWRSDAADISGIVGYNDYTNSLWTNCTVCPTVPCSTYAPIYCIEQ